MIPLGLAASLLLNVFLARTYIGDQEGVKVFAATAEVEPGEFRGAGVVKLPEVRVNAPFKGFVVVIALAPDRKQQVVPGLGADDIPVAAGEQSKGVIVPADSTRVLYVVTETSAGETIRRFLGDNNRRIMADQEPELRRELEELLKKKNYRWIAFGTSDVTKKKF